jgi:hypothetical protein
MLIVGMSAMPVAAQEVLFGQTMGSVYLSDSPTEYQPNKMDAALFTPFSVYLVTDIDYGDIGQSGINGAVGMQAYEVGVDFPPELTLISATIRNLSVNLGGNSNLIVGLNPKITASQTPIDLVEFSLGAFSASTVLTDMHFTLHATTPSSFDPAVPGFNDSSNALECQKADGSPIKCLRPFAIAWQMSINCESQCVSRNTGRPNANTSWSALKGNFAN